MRVCAVAQSPAAPESHWPGAWWSPVAPGHSGRPWSSGSSEWAGRGRTGVETGATVPAAGAGLGCPSAPMALARAGQEGGSHCALTRADSTGRVALASMDLSQGQRRDGDPAGSSGQMREGLRESPEYCGENRGGGTHDAAPLSRFSWVYCPVNSQSTRLDTGRARSMAAASPGRGGGLVTPAPRCQPRGSASVYPLCTGGGDPPAACT